MYLTPEMLVQHTRPADVICSSERELSMIVSALEYAATASEKFLLEAAQSELHRRWANVQGF